jgi:hypothetical protein
MAIRPGRTGLRKRLECTRYVYEYGDFIGTYSYTYTLIESCRSRFTRLGWLAAVSTAIGVYE